MNYVVFSSSTILFYELCSFYFFTYVFDDFLIKQCIFFKYKSLRKVNMIMWLLLTIKTIY
jgi:hypothetical protein